MVDYIEMQLSFVQRAQWMVESHMGAHTTISGQRSTPPSSELELSLYSRMDF